MIKSSLQYLIYLVQVILKPCTDKQCEIVLQMLYPNIGNVYADVQGLTNLKAGYVVGGEGLISDATIQTIFGLEDVSDIITIYRE